MKNKIGLFITNNIIFVVLALVILMTVISLPPVVLEVMIGIEFIFLIAVLLSFMTYCKANPKLVVIFLLFSSILNIILTRISLSNSIQVSLLKFTANKIGEKYLIFNIIIIVTFLILQLFIGLKTKENYSELASAFNVIKSSQSELDSILKSENISEDNFTELKEEIIQSKNSYSNEIPNYLIWTAKVNISLALLNLIGGMIIQVSNLGCMLEKALKDSIVMTTGNVILFAVPVIVVSLIINIKKNKDIEIVKSKLKKYDELCALIEKRRAK